MMYSIPEFSSQKTSALRPPLPPCRRQSVSLLNTMPDSSHVGWTCAHTHVGPLLFSLFFLAARRTLQQPIPIEYILQFVHPFPFKVPRPPSPSPPLSSLYTPGQRHRRNLFKANPKIRPLPARSSEQNGKVALMDNGRGRSIEG